MRKGNSRSRRGAFGLSVVITITALTFIVTGQRTGRSRSSGTPISPTRIALNDPGLVHRYQEDITAEGLAAHLYFLASDFFEGRETTTRGQKLAAQYLASQYRQLGLTPKGTETADNPLAPSNYFQPFTVYRRNPKETRLDVLVDGSKVVSSTFSADYHDDLSYFVLGGAANSSGSVVFAGYGIADDKLGYNDYAALSAKNISLTDKWVLILDDEPLTNAATSLLPTADHKPSSWTQFINKRSAFSKAGKPKGVLVVSDLSPRTKETFVERSALASLNAQRVGALSLTPTSSVLPVYAISSRLANQILASSGQTIEDLKQQIDKRLSPVVFDLNVNVKVSTTVSSFEGQKTENILAYIEGSDPKLKDEVVIVSAHYDHLGINPTLKGDQIFNGAADDGSGIVACLEMAQAFMKAKREGFGPRRSILFANFTGEEKGLLGSTYYSRQPVVPLDKTVADINMDGVGGIDPNHPMHSKNYIYILGTEELSRDLLDATKRINKTAGLNLELTEGPRFSSDQYSFETQLVPYIYYSTGYTEKYHQPSDEPDTIAYDHLARVVQLIFATTWQVANQDAKPRTVDRSQLTLVGYICPPCSLPCDDEVHSHPGDCPVCGMTLVPKYKKSS